MEAIPPTPFRRPTRRPSRPSLSPRRAASILLLVSAALALTPGCAGPSSTSRPTAAGVGNSDPLTRVDADPAADLERAISDHRLGRFEEAGARATAVAERTSGRLREQAAYTAGVAWLEAGRLRESEEMLAVARRSADPALRARAEAAWGVGLLARGRDREAEAALDRAFDGLDAGDRIAAVAAASAVADRLGDPAMRARWTDRGRVRAATGSRRSDAAATQAASVPAIGWRDGWAIQIGAFTSRTRAETAAERASRRIDRSAYGEPRIIPRWSAGDRSDLLFVVQFGAFGSAADAEAAIRRHGWSDWIAKESAG